MFRLSWIAVAVVVGAALLVPAGGQAASAAKIEEQANAALGVFREEINGADVFLGKAAGYLIFRGLSRSVSVSAPKPERARCVSAAKPWTIIGRRAAPWAFSSALRRSPSSSRS